MRKGNQQTNYKGVLIKHIERKAFNSLANYGMKNAKILMTTYAGKDIRGTLLHCQWKCKLVQPLWKSVWGFLRKLGINIPQDPAISNLGTYPRDVKSYHKNTYSIMVTTVLFIMSRNWKQPRCPSSEEWIKKIRSIYSMELYSVVKNNNIMKFMYK